MRLSHVFPAAALAALCVSTFAPATARAQVSLSLGGGPTFPISNLNDTYSTGYNVMAALGVHIPTSPFGIRLDGMFNQLPDRPDLFGGTSFHRQIWTANANLLASLVPGGPVVPYLIAGVGFYNSNFNLSASNNSLSGNGSTNDNDLGVNGGGGVRVNFGGIGIFGEARYHYIFSSGTHLQMIPITFGVRFGG